MTTPPTHWIAGTGKITPVVIVETGTGGQSLAYVPPDPVVVRSIEDYFEFVASESALFTDKGQAMEESRRLRDQEVSQAKVLLSRLERQEALYGGLLPINPKILEDNTSGSSTPVVQMKVSSPSDPSTESSIPVEVVVAKNSSPKDPTKPRNLLECIIYVIGRETLSFDDICKRLEARGWFPKRRSSVSNTLSGYKNLFHIPEKGTYALRSKPAVSPVESDEASRLAIEATSVPSVESDEASGLVIEATGSEVPSDDDGEPQVAEQSEVPPQVEAKPVSVFDTWFSLPMTQLNPNRTHYHDENHEVILTEKLNSLGFWTAEIHIEGLDIWSSGTSKDRSEARGQARTNLNIKVKLVNDLLDKVPGLLDPEMNPG
jgi:hypothetical protein